MNLLKRERAVDVVSGSGLLRVTVTPKPAWFAMCLEAIIAVIVGSAVGRDWASIGTSGRIFFGWVLCVGVLGWIYQLSGSEIIEFDERTLTIRKQVLGWDRTRQYAVSDCHDLEWLERTGQDNCRLQCKAGWRTVKFGAYISEDEAVEILAALQTSLPEVAAKMMAVARPDREHFTTLKLS